MLKPRTTRREILAGREIYEYKIIVENVVVIPEKESRRHCFLLEFTVSMLYMYRCAETPPLTIDIVVVTQTTQT